MVCGNFGFECFCLFLFYFCLVWGEQVTDAQDFGWQSKGEGQFRSWFPFFFLFTWWQFCIVQILSGPKTFLHISYVFFDRELSFHFFCFLPLFDWEFFFSSSFFFVVFWGQGLTFSPWVKVYDKLGFWLKTCRMVGHDICQGLASGSGIKGMSYIISMIHMQQWSLGIFMQNYSCMQPCGHSSIKFLWSCDTRAQDSFSLFQVNPVFPKYVFL